MFEPYTKFAELSQSITFVYKILEYEITRCFTWRELLFHCLFLAIKKLLISGSVGFLPLLLVFH